MTEHDLQAMENDAAALKADLHVAEHVRKLANVVRSLSTKTVSKATVDEARVALEYIQYVGELDVVPSNVTTAYTKAVAVLDRFFS